MDAAGKGRTISTSCRGEPAGLRRHRLQAALHRGTCHDFLWRPPRRSPDGRIGSSTARTTRSPASSGCTPSCWPRRAPPGQRPANNVWEDRYEDINAFELHLTATAPGREDLPARLQGGAKEAVPPTPGRPGQVLEVLCRHLAERGHWDDTWPRTRSLTATSTAWRRGTWCRPTQVHLRALWAHRGPRHRRDGPTGPHVPPTPGGSGPQEGIVWPSNARWGQSGHLRGQDEAPLRPASRQREDRAPFAAASCGGRPRLTDHGGERAPTQRRSRPSRRGPSPPPYRHLAGSET